MELLAEYAPRGVRAVRLDSSRGAQAARNEGIRRSACDWIAFHDSDDIWLPNKLALQVDQLEQCERIEKVLVHCNGYMKKAKAETQELMEISRFHGRCYAKLLTTPGPMFPGMLVHKLQLQAIGLLDERCPSFQEWDTAIRLARVCEFVHVEEPLFVWVRHEDDSISRDFARDLAGFNYILEKHRDEIITHHGVHRWRALYLHNVWRALAFKKVEVAQDMLGMLPPHSSKLLAMTLAKMRTMPRGSDTLLRLAARLPF
jgi:glycosyltransferase involved in cell wall biosynthesis